MRKALLILLLILSLLLCACGSESKASVEPTISEEELAQIKEEIKAELEEEMAVKQPPEPEPTPIETPTPTEQVVDEDEIRPELKEFLDSYEAFIDEYVEFMNAYYKNPTDLALLSKYVDIMGRYSEFASTVDELDTSDMTNKELAYYLEVTSRASQKMILAIG